MKCVVLLLCLLVLISGCSMENDAMERAVDFRSELLSASEVSFHSAVVADYGDKIHSFGMDCQGNNQGEICFSVTEPETITGITGRISDDGGKLTFDDKVLFFGLLTDDQLSPVSAPWIILRSLRSGYIRSAGREGEYLRLSIDDSYDDVLEVDVWMSEDKRPVRGDILYDGKRILSMDIENFTFR